MAFVGPLLAAASSAATAAAPYAFAAGTTLDVMGQVQASRAQDAMDKYNINVLTSEQKAAEEKTKFDQYRHNVMGREIIASQRARAGTSGAVISSGSPLMAVNETISELALENALIGYEGQIEQTRLANEAQVSRFGMKERRKALPYRIGSTLLTDFAFASALGVFDFGSPGTFKNELRKSVKKKSSLGGSRATKSSGGSTSSSSSSGYKTGKSTGLSKTSTSYKTGMTKQA